MDQEQSQDYDLADYTDALLEGKPTASLPPLASTVKALVETACPESPPEHLRRKIHQRVVAEWARQQPSLGLRLSRLIRRPAQRWAWAIVAAVVLVVAGAALLAPSSNTALTGTVVGGAGIWVIPVIAVGVLAAAWFATHRK